ncbi:MAG TPA: protein kinase [Dehalococcoidia bacterium]|nr:protein kinase [Dehalococcoidia bacterium]
MASERIRRQIDRLLDEAEQAVVLRDWSAVRQHAQDALVLDPENGEALALVAAADRGLAGAASASVPSALPAAPAHREPVEGPTSFASGRYAVKRFLGEGGKKRVYLAHDTLLDRDVAFALIKTEGLDDAARARITREAQAMGRLGDHPHIVTVYDIGTEADQPYLVLPLMPGGDVEGLIEKAENHQLPLEQAIRITDQLCQALEHAHGKGIIHRDIKPGNIWLTQEGTAKLGDFGLAVAIDRSRLTQAGMMVGTVSYMPPEQAMGGAVEARSDLYSVGCMLYEMVTGRPPFVGDDNIAIIGQHLNTPPVGPSWHRPDVPKGLEALIMRLLEKDPNKRPASAREVRQSLASIGLTLDSSDVGAGLRPAPTGPTATDNPLYRRTFVGREAELRQLQAAFDGAMSGQGALAMVVGEPGIGKTALVEQLATYVSLRGGRTLVGHCYEEGSLSLPYLAFVEAMRSYVLSREPDALKSELGTGAADVARIVSEIRDRVQVELRPPGDPEDDRWRLLQSVSGFLRNAANVQPLVIVVEDLHWADRGTLDLLLHVARNLQGARLLIVGTYRDVEVDRSHPLSGALAELSRIASFSRVRLRGLTAEEVQRMLSSLAAEEIGWALAEAVHRQTEGNPLFVQEVLRYLAEEGLIAREEGRWRSTSQTPLAMQIPEGLRDVIGKRLSRLTPECNRCLSIAAVIGRDFRVDVLQRVAGLSEDELITLLTEANKATAIEERSSVGATVTYRFTHAFFRQTLYEEMIAPQRIRLHQQVARALEEVYAGRLEEHAVELAEHFSYSSDSADLAKAVAYGEMAARRALSVYAYTEAVGHLERCLRVQEVLDPADKAKRCDLLLALGEALLPAGEAHRAYDEVAEEAFALAETLGDQHRASRACKVALDGLARSGTVTMSRTPVFRRWAEKADRNAAHGTAERVRADMALANVLESQGRNADAWAIRVRNLDLARELNDPDFLFRAARNFFGNGGSPRREAEFLRLAQEFSAAPREGVGPRTLGVVLNFAGSTFLEHGERGRAEELFAQVNELAARTQDATLQMYPIQAEISVATLDGDLEAAVHASERLVARADELGAPVLGRQFARRANYALVHLGRGEEALASVGAAREMAGVEAAVAEEAQTARLLAQIGRSAEAREMLRRLLAELNVAQEENETFTGTLLHLLEAATLLEEREATLVLSQLVDSVRTMSLWRGTYTCPARLLGAASALLGKPEQARADYQQALDVAGKVGHRPETALTRLHLAELLLEESAKPNPLDLRSSPPQPNNDVGARSPRPGGVGEGASEGEETSPLRGVALAAALRTEALEHLDFAIKEFREMKMQPSLERALRHRGLLKA